MMRMAIAMDDEQYKAAVLSVTGVAVSVKQHPFVGRREWGLDAKDDAPCQVCGVLKVSHARMEDHACKGILNVGGQHYPCTVQAPHQGLACSNTNAGAIWYGPTDMERDHGKR